MAFSTTLFSEPHTGEAIHWQQGEGRRKEEKEGEKEEDLSKVYCPYKQTSSKTDEQTVVKKSWLWRQSQTVLNQVSYRSWRRLDYNTI